LLKSGQVADLHAWYIVDEGLDGAEISGNMVNLVSNNGSDLEVQELHESGGNADCGLGLRRDLSGKELTSEEDTDT
jgi:hypothetical protein